MKNLNHRECIKLIDRQIKAKGFCCEDDAKALRYHKRQQTKNRFNELKIEISRPIIKALDWLNKVLFKKISG